MLFWHLGATVWLFRWIFRDPKVDVRFLLVGAILPDLVDLPVGTLLLPGRYSTAELWAHSLLIPTIYMAGVLLVTRRGRRRRAWMALGVGWLLHLLLDGMWIDEKVFLWPFFGVDISPGPAPFWSNAWNRALSDPWRWLLEILGAAYLLWLWFAVRLNERDHRRSFFESGRLPARVSDSPGEYE